MGGQVFQWDATGHVRCAEPAVQYPFDDRELPGATPKILPLRSNEHQHLFLLLLIPRPLKNRVSASPVRRLEHP